MTIDRRKTSQSIATFYKMVLSSYLQWYYTGSPYCLTRSWPRLAPIQSLQTGVNSASYWWSCTIHKDFNTASHKLSIEGMSVSTPVSQPNKKLYTTSPVVSDFQFFAAYFLLTQDTESAQSDSSVSFTGPQNGDYSDIGHIDIASVVWSPCGSETALNIDGSLQLHSSNPNAAGQITTDSVDTRIEFVVGLQWKTC